MTFAQDPWLLATGVLLFCLLLAFLYGSRLRHQRLRRLLGSPLAKTLTASFSPNRQRIKLALVLLAVMSLGLALARPQYGYTLTEKEARGSDLLFALDVSRSMLAPDIKPDRLSRAKFAILDLLAQTPGDRVGLVAFAGRAFLQVPLTLDHDGFRQTLEALDTSAIPSPGTDIAAAISEAQAYFGDESTNRVLILITDGEDLEARALTQAREAAENGIIIYTVGVGTGSGELIPITTPDGQQDFLRDAEGKPVKTRLDEETLAAIAQATGGFYVRLGTGEGLTQVYREGIRELTEADRRERVSREPIERFSWPLACAIAALGTEYILGTRRRRIPSPTR